MSLATRICRGILFGFHVLRHSKDTQRELANLPRLFVSKHESTLDHIFLVYCQYFSVPWFKQNIFTHTLGWAQQTIFHCENLAWDDRAGKPPRIGTGTGQQMMVDQSGIGQRLFLGEDHEMYVLEIKYSFLVGMGNVQLGHVPTPVSYQCPSYYTYIFTEVYIQVYIYIYAHLCWQMIIS